MILQNDLLQTLLPHYNFFDRPGGCKLILPNTAQFVKVFDERLKSGRFGDEFVSELLAYYSYAFEGLPLDELFSGNQVGEFVAFGDSAFDFLPKLLSWHQVGVGDFGRRGLYCFAETREIFGF